MILIGLSGGIGAGKSTVARIFSECGFAVFDADKAVKSLYRQSYTLRNFIERKWPEIFRHGRLDFALLKEKAFEDPDNLTLLERWIHPLLKIMRQRFIERARKRGFRYCVLDVPLLIETDLYKECDYVIWIKAPLAIRLERVEKRATLTQRQLNMLLARQAGNAERERCADYVLDASQSVENLKEATYRLIDEIKKRQRIEI